MARLAANLLRKVFERPFDRLRTGNSFRPSCEALEDRSVPAHASVSWVTSQSDTVEGGTPGYFHFTLTGGNSQPVTVSYAVGGSAVPNADYVALSGSVTFQALQNAVDVPVNPIDDTIAEFDESVELTITPGSGYTVGDSNASVVIISDNEQPVVSVQNISDAAEGGGPGTIRIGRMGDTSSPLNVDFTTVGTAASGSDYSPIGISATIPSGAWYTDLAVNAIDDSIVDPNESVALTVQPSSSYGLTSPAAATVTIVDNDGIASSPPVAVDDFVSTHPNNSIAIDPLDGDSDADGDVLSVSGIAQPAHGTATLFGGIVTYTPNMGFAGDDQFTYTVSDDNGGTATGTVNITVGNLSPTADDLSATIHANRSATFDLLGSAADPEGDSLTATAGTPSNGTVSVDANGIATYTPASGYAGTDSFNYTVSDGYGGTATATASISVGDDGPTAADSSVSVHRDGTATIDALALASSPYTDATLTLTGVSTPAHGTATQSDGIVTYTPGAGYTGVDSFTYSVSDGFGGTATGTVSVTVGADNPTADDIAVPVHKFGPAVLDVMASASSPYQDASMALTGWSTPAHGSVSLDADGNLVYAPASGYIGPDLFTYTVSDGHGGTATGSVNLTVGNDNPIPEDVSVSVAGNDSVMVNVLASASSPYQDVMPTLTGLSTPAHGTVSLDPNGNVIYTPTAGYSGADSFTFTVADGYGGTASGSAFIAVGGGTLVAVDDRATTTNNRQAVVAVLANDSGPVGATISVIGVGLPSSGSASINGNGTITYTPNSTFVGTATFTYTIADSYGETASATVSVTVSNNTSTGSISGVVWVDANVDMAINSGEAMAPGVTVELYGDDGSQLQLVTATVTDGSGHYSISTQFLTSGFYRLHFVDPSGSDFTNIRADGWTDSMFIAQNANLAINAGKFALAAAKTPFTTILRDKLVPTNSARWDINKDGKISVAEVDQLMELTGTSEVTGDAAAALAELKGASGPLKKLVTQWSLVQGVSVRTIQEYERLYALRNGNPVPADVKKVALVVGIEKDFAALKERLVEAMKGANVIAPNSKPGTPFGGVVTYDVPDGPAAATNQDASKVKQGMIGDCAFLATIIGMVRARGGTSPIVTIGKNIDPTNTQFDYRVKFPGADSADRIKRPTQSQIALYANAGDNGLWLSILEKGYAKARKQNYDDFFGGFFSKDTYRVLEGQSLKDAMKIITGRKPAVNLSGSDLTAGAVRNQLQAVMGVPDKNGYAPLKVIATAGSLPSDQDPTDLTLLPAGHAYAVIGYNKETKKIRLENPWHNPAYVNYGTTFDMDVAEFVTKYGVLCIESRIGVNAQQ